MHSTAPQTVKPGKRALAAAALGLGLLAATTACSATSAQQTTHQYAASDGVNAQFGDIKVRNVMLVSDGEKNPGRLLGSIFNGSKQDVTVTVNGAEGSQTQVRVKANDEVSLNEKSDAAILSTTGGAPGSLVSLQFSGEGKTDDVKVPVLDGTIKEYKQYLPAPKATPGASTKAEPTTSATPESTSTTEGGH
ncbi:hypothetical protein [Arthrobacter woluwensis]|uniref:DNA modification methylase n=1 Tax=Arthrobacter woluwensis TaxID=156980 RepID=A0A1H4VJL4_9MICC|nr:hypothetical protein [Arthrobacter woluwensis]SEC80778.1 hypothetical protein SAMN04489745_3214 [Arthrobacter woluwensis]